MVAVSALLSEFETQAAVLKEREEQAAAQLRQAQEQVDGAGVMHPPTLSASRT